MVAPVDFKAHHNIPKLKELAFNLKRPLAVPYNLSPEYGEAIVNNVEEFVFPENHYPGRISDIFVQDVTSLSILDNRLVNREDGKPYSRFQYNYGQRKITFNYLLSGEHKIVWLDFSKLRIDRQHWIELPIFQSLTFNTKPLLQGFSRPYAQGPTPTNILDDDDIVFQGAYKCHLEIDTLPVYGMVCYNNQLNAFMYRGSVQTPNPIDTFQYRLYNSLGQESDPYCVKIYLS